MSMLKDLKDDMKTWAREEWVIFSVFVAEGIVFFYLIFTLS